MISHNVAQLPGAVLGFIPSPSSNVWHLGPIPVRAYALAIVTGIVVAVVLGNARWKKRGGLSGEVVDVAIWAVPFGIVGGRIYHVLTDWNAYFGPHGNPAQALRIWEGGLGIWGAVFFGAIGAWIGAVRHGIKLPPLADALAPGVVFAQAIGRLGNWFNQELFGRPTTLPWGLKIDPAHRPAGYEQYATFHPTFLYELIWNVFVGFFVIWADRRFKLGHGRAFALYIAMYTAGRAFVESVRIDEAAFLFGLRFNFMLAIVVSISAFIFIAISARTRPGRETPAELHRGGWSAPSGEQALNSMSAVLAKPGEAPASLSNNNVVLKPHGSGALMAAAATEESEGGDPDDELAAYDAESAGHAAESAAHEVESAAHCDESAEHQVESAAHDAESAAHAAAAEAATPNVTSTAAPTPKVQQTKSTSPGPRAPKAPAPRPTDVSREDDADGQAGGPPQSR